MKFRVIALCLVLAVGISLFAGCGNEVINDVGTMTPEEIEAFEAKAGGLKLPFDDKGTEIKIFISGSNENLTDSVAIKEASRRTGLKISMNVVPAAAVGDKAKVIVASKTDLPDIFMAGLDFDTINDLAMQGAFAAVNDYLDDMPNFTDLYITRMEELGTEKVMKGYIAPDNKLYQIPSYGINRDVNHGMLYRKDIFDKHGLTMWDGPDSFYATAKKLKELYPESSPLTAKTGVAFFEQLLQSWGIPNWPELFYDYEKQTWNYAAIDPRFKEMLDYFKRMYDEKLIDAEFLTLTQAAWTAKMTQADKAFLTFDWIGRLDMFREQAEKVVPGYDLRYGRPVGPVQKVVTINPISSGCAITKNDNSRFSMMLIDYMLSEGGAELMTCGIEGVTFNWNEDGTKAEYIGFEEGKAISLADLETKYGMCSYLTKRYDPRCFYFNYTEREQEAQDMMNNMPGGGYLKENPVLNYTQEELDVISQKDPNLQKAAEEFATKYILTDETGDAAWSAFLQKMNNLGVQDVIAVANAAQVRYNAN